MKPALTGLELFVLGVSLPLERDYATCFPGVEMRIFDTIYVISGLGISGVLQALQVDSEGKHDATDWLDRN